MAERNRERRRVKLMNKRWTLSAGYVAGQYFHIQDSVIAKTEAEAWRIFSDRWPAYPDLREASSAPLLRGD